MRTPWDVRKLPRLQVAERQEESPVSVACDRCLRKADPPAIRRPTDLRGDIVWNVSGAQLPLRASEGWHYVDASIRAVQTVEGYLCAVWGPLRGNPFGRMMCQTQERFASDGLDIEIEPPLCVAALLFHANAIRDPSRDMAGAVSVPTYDVNGSGTSGITSGREPGRR
jgi:hypothetical protein